MLKEEVEIICEDNTPLHGVLLIPDAPTAVIQFNCGTATPKAFYLPFITYLSEHGYVCCLWSYRDADKGDALRNCNIRYADYGMKDIPAVKSYLEGRFPQLPYIFIGHSTGGQQIGFVEQLDNVRGIINIAVSAAYYPNILLPQRLKAYFFFYIFTPISVAICGYVKAKPFGLMENLPKGVVYEWRDWCSSKVYFFDSKYYGITVPIGNFKNFKMPIYVYYAEDDSISNINNTEAFWSNVTSDKEIKIISLHPNDYGVKKIDHFGYFKKNMKDTFWKKIVDNIEEIIKNSK